MNTQLLSLKCHWKDGWLSFKTAFQQLKETTCCWDHI
jgi:hypothetical protein